MLDLAHFPGMSDTYAHRPRADVTWIERGREYIGRKWAALTEGWPDLPDLDKEPNDA